MQNVTLVHSFMGFSIARICTPPLGLNLVQKICNYVLTHLNVYVLILFKSKHKYSYIYIKIILFFLWLYVGNNWHITETLILGFIMGLNAET